MERTSSDIRVWFWPRNGAVPSGIQSGATAINTDNWGTPAADFPNTSCNYAQYFDAHHIIINLTFCGQWAGVVYSQDGCLGTCTGMGALTDEYRLMVCRLCQQQPVGVLECVL